MFCYFKKYLLIVIFLGTMPSTYTMDMDKIYLYLYGTRMLFGDIPGFFSHKFNKFSLLSIPSQLFGYQIRKESALEQNIVINGKSLHRIKITPETTDIASGGLIGIMKKADTLLLRILETALKNGYFEKDDEARIKTFLICGADPNLKIKDQTILHVVALLQNDNLFNYVIQHGADCNAVNNYGKTPFDIKNANAALIKILETVVKNNKLKKIDSERIIDCIEQGVHPNFKFGPEQTPLISLAAKYEKRNLFNYLLQNGADINACDIDKETPLHICISEKSHQNDAWFSGKYSKDFYEILEDLLKNGANVNAMNRWGITPLLIVINGEPNFDLINYLIQYGANVNYKVDRWSPLSLAITYPEDKPSIEITKILCNAGVSSLTDIDDEGNTAFHLLVTSRRPPNHIETVITDVHLKDDKEITKTIKATLWAFNNNDPNSTIPQRFPKEIVMHILSMLLSPEYFHQGLYNELWHTNHRNYEPRPLLLVNNHIHRCVEILKIKNHKNQTAQQLASNIRSNIQGFVPNNPEYSELLSGKRLIKDLNVFNKKYHNISSIPHDNLALRIYQKQNHQQIKQSYEQILKTEVNNLD